jgi:hypothetical protein
MKYKYYNEYCTPVTVANREVDGMGVYKYCTLV